jgi:phosphonatase-like hydrolase
MIELVAFDMAGTTIDDHGLVYEALAQSVRETGASLSPADLQQWMGTEKTSAIAALLRLGGVEPDPARVAAAFDRFRGILAASYVANPPVGLPGVEAALRELRGRGILVALTTGFSDDVAYPLLESLGWVVGDQLDAVVTASDVASGRPAPDMIHHAMELTGITDASTVLAAGDTAVDVLAARNAGVTAVGVLTGKLSRAEFERLDHDYVLDSVVDVLDLAGLSGSVRRR